MALYKYAYDYDYDHENITVMIYFIFVRYMNHRMQIAQERPECDLMSNSVKFMQQASSSHCQVTVMFVSIR